MSPASSAFGRRQLTLQRFQLLDDLQHGALELQGFEGWHQALAFRLTGEAQGVPGFGKHAAHTRRQLLGSHGLPIGRADLIGHRKHHPSPPLLRCKRAITLGLGAEITQAEVGER